MNSTPAFQSDLPLAVPPRSHPDLLALARATLSRERARTEERFGRGLRLREARGRVELLRGWTLLSSAACHPAPVPHSLDAVGWVLREARAWWVVRRAAACWRCGRPGPPTCEECRVAWRAENALCVEQLKLPLVGLVGRGRRRRPPQVEDEDDLDDASMPD